MRNPFLSPTQRPQHKVPKAWRPLAVALSMLIAMYVAAPSAQAGWLNPLCIGFSTCNSKNLGNAGYQNEYKIRHWGMYGGHNCTNYAAYRLIKAGVPNLNFPAGQGDAYNWSNIATQRGYLTDKSPRVGDIAWFGKNALPGMYWGHVAYVESIDLAAGKVRVSEDNSDGDFQWRDYYIRDVTGFIHLSSSGATATTSSNFSTAFEANTNNLWNIDGSGGGDLRLGMMPGTSPSITRLATGGYQLAFQANTGSLWTTGAAGTKDWGLGMMKGTSPAIAGLQGGGFEVAFQANTGNLWYVGQGGGSIVRGDRGLGMKSGTSPAIAALPAGGFDVAFQANTGNLWVVGEGPGSITRGDWGLGMMAGTSPDITGLPGGGYQVAFQANTSSLWTVGQGGGSATSGARNLGMNVTSSPSIRG